MTHAKLPKVSTIVLRLWSTARQSSSPGASSKPCRIQSATAPMSVEACRWEAGASQKVGKKPPWVDCLPARYLPKAMSETLAPLPSRYACCTTQGIGFHCRQFLAVMGKPQNRKNCPYHGGLILSLLAVTNNFIAKGSKGGKTFLGQLSAFAEELVNQLSGGARRANKVPANYLTKIVELHKFCVTSDG